MSMPRPCWLLLIVGVVVVAAVSGSPVSAQQENIPYIPLRPTTQFSAGAEFLLYTRDTNLQSPAPLIGGPDSALMDPGSADFNPAAGYRAFLAWRSGGVRLEAVYTEIGSWKENSAGRLTDGLSFDSGITGPWLGANYIDLTTGFQPLHLAAAGAVGGDGDEYDGLTPSITIPAVTPNDLPTYNMYYESEFKTFEFNGLTDDQMANFQFGFGFRNLQLDEASGASIIGSMYSEDLGPGTNNGISHAFLTGNGGLTLLSGTGNGFEDEVGNPSGLPDILTLQNFARTSNDLNGVQGLLERRVMYWHGFRVDGILKAGIYHNRVRGSVTDIYTGTDPDLAGDTSTYGRTLSDSASTVSFLGSIGLTGTLPLGNYWSLIGGYDVLFLTNVALAPDQNAAVNGGVYGVNADGDVIIHGGRIGLQYTY